MKAHEISKDLGGQYNSRRSEGVTQLALVISDGESQSSPAQAAQAMRNSGGAVFMICSILQKILHDLVRF